LGLGFNFAATDFIKRGDAKPACIGVNGVLVVRTNLRKRLPARVLELNAHIDWLKENGFKTIYVVGFSEGGMVIQRMQKVVDAVVIHSMTCIPLPPFAKLPTDQNKYLQLISTRDPFLDTQGAVPCEGRKGYETFSSAVGNAPTHDPFSDPSWAVRIKQFLGVDK
jgi:dienelactone hydrolase